MSHLIFSSETQTAKLFHAGALQWEAPMHDAAVNGPGFGRWGRIPRGLYNLSRPVPMDHPAFGHWFIPVGPVPTRIGIGIHGGGSGLADPFADHQGWVPTHGCLRLQNADLRTLVEYLKANTEKHWISVEGS